MSGFCEGPVQGRRRLGKNDIEELNREKIGHVMVNDDGAVMIRAKTHPVYQARRNSRGYQL